MTVKDNGKAKIIDDNAERQYLVTGAERIKNATIIRANGTEVYLTQLYLQAPTIPESNIEYIIIAGGGVPIIA